MFHIKLLNDQLEKDSFGFEQVAHWKKTSDVEYFIFIPLKFLT